jgi:hypothetical protein
MIVIRNVNGMLKKTNVLIRNVMKLLMWLSVLKENAHIWMGYVRIFKDAVQFSLNIIVEFH